MTTKMQSRADAAILDSVHEDDRQRVLEAHANLPGQRLATTVDNLLAHAVVRPALTPATPTPRFLVKIAGIRDAFGAETLADASAGFLRVQREIQDRSGWTKTIRHANVYDPARGGTKRIARISQNGRVWHPTLDVEMVDKTGGAL